MIDFEVSRRAVLAGMAALPLTADVTGARYVRLVQTIGGDTNSYDRGDWAEPRLVC